MKPALGSIRTRHDTPGSGRNASWSGDQAERRRVYREVAATVRTRRNRGWLRSRPSVGSQSAYSCRSPSARVTPDQNLTKKLTRRNRAEHRSLRRQRGPCHRPSSLCPGLCRPNTPSRSTSDRRGVASSRCPALHVVAWVAGTSPAMTAERGRTPEMNAELLEPERPHTALPRHGRPCAGHPRRPDQRPLVGSLRPLRQRPWHVAAWVAGQPRPWRCGRTNAATCASYRPASGRTRTQRR